MPPPGSLQLLARFLALLSLFVLLASSSASAQEDVLRSWTLPADSVGFPFTPRVLPDVTGDAVPEILIGDFLCDVAGTEDAGTVLLYSGEALDPPRLLRSHAGTEEDEYFGSELVVLGDVDGDGWRDYAAGTSSYAVAPRILVFGGRDGRLLFEKPVASRVNYTLCDLGDVTGDGRADALLGSDVHAGGSFALLYGLPRPGEDNYPMAVSLRGDVDGDGAPDFVYNMLNVSYTRSTTYVYSGRSGALLHSKFVLGSGATHSLASPGDIDGDGDPDFAEGNYLDPRVRFRDGATGSLLGPLAGGWPYDGAPQAMLMGDLDGNGRPELFLQQGRDLLAIDLDTRDLLWKVEGQPSSYAPRIDGGDWNRDGFPDFLIATSLGMNATLLEVRSGTFARAATESEPRCGIRALGKPCTTGGPAAPRIATSGLPLVGEDLRVNVSGLMPAQPVLLVVGDPGARQRPRSGCGTSVSGRLLACTTTEVARGVWIASTVLPIPAELELVGSLLHVQGILLSARGSSAATTRVLECQLGIGAPF